jgi:4'-phosphopantetheinyl transferase EntD
VRVDEVPELFDDPRVLVLTAELDDAAIAGLTPREAESVSRAVLTRKRELATGRALARLALERQGHPGEEIPVAADRAPIWPDAIAGSISHSDTRAIVAVGRRAEIGSVGIDLERGPELARDLWSAILLPEEVDAIDRLDLAQRGQRALLLFAAKEALYKAQYPVSRTFMEFHALRVDVEPASPTRGALVCTFQIAVPPFDGGTVVRGRYLLGAFSPGDVLTGVAIPSDQIAS